MTLWLVAVKLIVLVSSFLIIFTTHNCNQFVVLFVERCGNLMVFLQSEYAQHNDAILLVVIPAAQAPEIASAKALRIAKEYDGECGFAFNPASWHVIFLS